jgi:hypothetical protein
MDRKWRKVLSDYNLPYFHTADCAHGTPPFDHLTAEERDAVARKMIALIGAHAGMGVGITVNEHEYGMLMVRHPMFGDAYSFCARHCFSATRAYIEDHGLLNEGNTSRISSRLVTATKAKQTAL